MTLTATPAAGATFSGWGGSCTGTSTTCSVLMNAAKSVTATFTTGGGGGGSTFLLSVSVSGSGSVTGTGISCGNGGAACSANIPSGASVTLTATPAAGATFSGWGGACSGTAPTCTVTMTSTRAVTATFTAAAPGTLSITVTGKGTVFDERRQVHRHGRREDVRSAPEDQVGDVDRDAGGRPGLRRLGRLVRERCQED